VNTPYGAAEKVPGVLASLSSKSDGASGKAASKSTVKNVKKEKAQ